MLTSMGDLLREAQRRGWITTRDGNVSLRRGNSLYITPSGGRKSIIHPEHIMKAKIDSEGQLIWEDKTQARKASGELEMHRLLQTTDFSKTRAVVHLHPTYILAAMYKGWNLQQLAAEFAEVGRYTKVGPTVRELPVTSQILATETFQAMTEVPEYQFSEKLVYDIVGQAGHGVCAVARTPWDAFEHIERLEHICQIVLASGVSPK